MRYPAGMRTRLLLITLFATTAFSQESEIAKGLRNLAEIHRIANVIELRRTLAGTLPLELPKDPWGTPYYIEEGDSGYRIIGAGSDAKFDAAVPPPGQFEGTAGDVVLVKGQVTRSNRNWLYAQAQNDPAAKAELAALTEAEVTHTMMRVPVFQALTGVRATAMSMQLVGKYIETNKTAPAPELSLDAWGTPLRITINPNGTYRVVSAGADRTFDETSWTRAATDDVAEDLVFENGKLTRTISPSAVLKASNAAATPLPQPPDASLAGTGRWVTIEEGVTAPFVETRVEPRYPEEYRMARISGIVILQAAISETGAIEHIGVLKSVAPGLDMAAVEAVRQWKFKPATKDGQPVPALLNLTINFRLK